MNIQPIEKADLQDDGSLALHSLFYTIQGEGPDTGRPAMFVRLWGCNLQCPGCDTDYTSEWERISAAKLAERVTELKDDECPGAPTPIVVITGGEPFRQNIAVFANMMIVRGWEVHVETNGTLPPPDILSTQVKIICSPKAGKINSVLEPRIAALKYVVKEGCIDRKDGLPIRALDHPCSPVVAKPPLNFKGQVFVQPMDEGNPHLTRRNTTAAVNSCKAFGHTLQLQTHKFAGIE